MSLFGQSCSFYYHYLTVLVSLLFFCLFMIIFCALLVILCLFMVVVFYELSVDIQWLFLSICFYLFFILLVIVQQFVVIFLLFFSVCLIDLHLHCFSLLSIDTRMILFLLTAVDLSDFRDMEWWTLGHSEGVVGGSCAASHEGDLLFRHRNVNAETSPPALSQHAGGQRAVLS